MSRAATKNTYLLPSEYLEGETYSDTRHEYINGNVYAMAGESKAHNIIVGNIYTVLRHHLRGSLCRVYMENVKVQIKTARSEHYFYPDVQVSCAAAGGNAYYEQSPKLIIEVLSPATERFDRADKFYAYRSLDSLEEYILVAQDTPRVEIYRRNTHWEWELYTDDASDIRLESVGATLTFKTIYESVEEWDEPKKSTIA